MTPIIGLLVAVLAGFLAPRRRGVLTSMTSAMAQRLSRKGNSVCFSGIGGIGRLWPSEITNAGPHGCASHSTRGWRIG